MHLCATHVPQIERLQRHIRTRRRFRVCFRTPVRGALRIHSRGTANRHSLLIVVAVSARACILVWRFRVFRKPTTTNGEGGGEGARAVAFDRIVTEIESAQRGR